MPATDDTLMPWLVSPETGTLLAVSDHENDRLGKRIVFTESRWDEAAFELKTWVYVVAIDPATGSWIHESIFDPLFAYGTQVLDETGEAVAIGLPQNVKDTAAWFDDTFSSYWGALTVAAQSVFPNGAEWSHVAGAPAAWVYYSARVGGANAWQSPQFSDAEIRFVEDLGGGTWAAHDTVPFTTPGYDRFLVNASYSEILGQRILFYVNTPRYDGHEDADWNSNDLARGTWCIHDPALFPLGVGPNHEYKILPIDPEIRVRSAPARPIPDAYAVLIGYYTDDTRETLELAWFHLVADSATNQVVSDRPNPDRTVRLRSYGPDVKLIGLGARRAPNRDSGGAWAYVLYACFTEADPDTPPTPRNRDPRRSFYDAYLVMYTGPQAVGGQVETSLPADIATWVQVESATRMRPVPNRPYDTFKCITDDESFSDAADEPWITFIMGEVDTDAAQASVVVVAPALGSGTAPYDPTAPLTEDLVTPTRISELTQAPGPIRIDPEPMLLDSGEVFVYYQQTIPDGATPSPVVTEVEVTPGTPPHAEITTDPRTGLPQVEFTPRTAPTVEITTAQLAWTELNVFRRARAM